jgi:hypothetical protein
MSKIYSKFHNKFFDLILIKKRIEMNSLIIKEIENDLIYDAMDVGTTSDCNNPSSNYLIKNLSKNFFFKSLSNQKIIDPFFSLNIHKSITSNFNNEEIKRYNSDLVISNATIEHVGNFDQQLKMIQNIIDLTKKKFFIITPNRYHPIEFHTKLPLIHWLPKNFHRKLLKYLRFDHYSLEENLNLLSKNDIHQIMKKIKFEKYKILQIKFLGFYSNFIVIGDKNNPH